MTGLVVLALGIATKSSLEATVVTYLIGTLALTIIQLFWFSFQYFRSEPRRGQSPGKQAMAIKIVRLDGLPISFSTYLVRVWVAGLINAITLGLFMIATNLWPLWDARRQTLHDKLAGTVVLDLRGETAAGRAPQQSRSNGILTAAVIAAVIAIASGGAGIAMIASAVDSNSTSLDQLADDVDPTLQESDVTDDQSTLQEDDLIEPEGDAGVADGSTTGDSLSSGSSRSETPEFDGWITQLASFRRLVNAEDGRDTLIGVGVDARILRSNEINELRRGFWVVYAGPFATRDEAERVARRAGKKHAKGAFARMVTVR
ncbi:MAG: RDD family protein [Solirubrobacterales bacterium]